jgi:hypothetical protein
MVRGDPCVFSLGRGTVEKKEGICSAGLQSESTGRSGHVDAG